MKSHYSFIILSLLLFVAGSAFGLPFAVTTESSSGVSQGDNIDGPGSSDITVFAYNSSLSGSWMTTSYASSSPQIISYGDEHRAVIANPEPTTIGLFGIGLLGIALYWRKMQ